MMMQRTAYAALACGVIAAPLLISTALGRSATADAALATDNIIAFAGDLLAGGYKAAPALMLGLALLAVIPLIAVLAPVLRRATEPEDRTRRLKPRAIDDIASKISGEIAGHAAHGFLEVVGNERARFSMARDMIRIGREDDNDIRIDNAAVHRYHAAIYRQGRDDWHVADLSGADGNGVRVNGKRCYEARLVDGDIIELGPGKLRYRAGLAATGTA